jgi:hypothetical protein
MKPLNHAKKSIINLLFPAANIHSAYDPGKAEANSLFNASPYVAPSNQVETNIMAPTTIIKEFPKKLASYFLVLMLAVLVTGCGGSGNGEQGTTASGITSPVVARIGAIVAVRVGETAVLDGSKSSTSMSAPLSFNWAFSHKPHASKAELQGASTANPSFVADAKGVYMVQLIASANGVSSQRAIQTVIVTLHGERHPTGRFNHQGLSSDCVNCHNGELVDPGKSPDHIATSNLCQACHTPQGAAIIPFADHLEVFGNCSECHNGITAVGKSEFHTPTTAECDDCHNTTSFLELELDGSFDHSNISRSCSGCHNGTVAIGKTPSISDTPPGTHPDTNTECGYCHTTSSFLPAYPDHTGPDVVGNRCDSCHNGGTAAGEPSGHPVMNVDCESCHSINTFSLGGVFNHAVVDSISQQCDVCHTDNNSINARGTASATSASAVSAHNSTSADCGTCHSTDNFIPAFNDHIGVVDNCQSCHGITATGKSLNHMPTNPNDPGTANDQDCVDCHTFGTFRSGTYDHVGVTNGCASCHDNVITVGKLPNHVTTSHLANEDCSVCHNTTAYVPATFVHTGIVDNCESCHNGNITIGKETSHLPTTQDCSVCHATSNIDNSTFKDTPNFAHTGISGNCESCHGGTPAYVAVGATAKLSNHIPAQGQCEVCHLDTTTGGFASAATFKSAVHDGFSQGCEGCHVSKFLPTANGVQDVIKAPNHLPTNQDCYLCHTITAFTPSIFGHTGITGNCASCHDGSSRNASLGALGKAQAPTPHPATTADCGACHAIGNNFTDGTFDHTGIVNNCSSCHGDNPTSTPVGPMKHTGHLPTTQDCSICHVPGTFTTAVFDHTGIVNDCASCHNGTNATGLTPTHLDTQGRDCSVCHNTTAFAGARYDHTGITNGCATCHDGATASGKTPPPNHVPTNGDCSDCHQTTGFVPATFDHVGIVDNCSSCHDAGFATPKSTGHVATAQDCSVCHNTRTFVGAVFDHTGITNGCENCHDGNTAIGKDAKTNPAHLVTGLDCNACHTTATFVGGTWVHDASTANTCDNCHRPNGGATPKSGGHLSTTEQCDVCHSTNGWAPTNFNHSPSGNYPGDHRRDPGCNGCHKGSIGAGLTIENYPSQLRYAPFCAGCHAGDFESEDDHIGGRSGTIEQNKNCAGSGCHSVNSSEF